jgi:hypothetical protein
MNVTGRVLALAVAASSVLGGSIGALVTAATNSSASPAAIAAAVQRVKDTTADARLAAISHTLETINFDLGGTGNEPPSQVVGEHTDLSVLDQICKNGVTGGLGEKLKC